MGRDASADAIHLDLRRARRLLGRFGLLFVLRIFHNLLAQRPLDLTVSCGLWTSLGLVQLFPGCLQDMSAALATIKEP